MRIVQIGLLIFKFCFVGQGQTTGIDLSEYLKPKCDTLYYNCIYNSFHASGIHDTIQLVYRKVPVGSDIAYYLATTTDTTGRYAWLTSFTGSAMIFKNDSTLLASLSENHSPAELTKDDFTHILSSDLKFSKPFLLAELKWSFVMKIFIKNFQFEDVSIGDTVLKKCLRLNLLVCDRLINRAKQLCG